MIFADHFLQGLDFWNGQLGLVQDLDFGHEEFGFVEAVLVEVYFSESEIVDVVEVNELGNNGGFSV